MSEELVLVEREEGTLGTLMEMGLTMWQLVRQPTMEIKEEFI